MKKFILGMVVLWGIQIATAQPLHKIIKEKEVRRIEKKLSSDEMEGRRTFTPGIEKASAYIEKEFKKTGLQTFNGAANFRQEFFMYESVTDIAKINIDGKTIPDSLVAGFSFLPQVKLTEKNEVEVVQIKGGDKFGQKFYQYYQSKKNLLVLVDGSFNTRLGSIKKKWSKFPPNLETIQ